MSGTPNVKRCYLLTSAAQHQQATKGTSPVPTQHSRRLASTRGDGSDLDAVDELHVGAEPGGVRCLRKPKEWIGTGCENSFSACFYSASRLASTHANGHEAEQDDATMQ